MALRFSLRLTLAPVREPSRAFREPPVRRPPQRRTHVSAPHPATTAPPPRRHRRRARRARSGARRERHAAHEARSAVKQLKLYYEANGGRRRFAYLVLPSWCEPARNPPLPLVIAPHGAGPGPFLALTRVWGDLASRGPFAVVIPQGQGRELTHYSYGYAGQVDDLARMPAIVREAVPWLRIDPRRIYAVGGSMGGQEPPADRAVPGSLAGAAAFDAPTDLPLRYEQFADVKGTEYRRTLVRDEIGAAPAEDPRAYAERSPITFVPAIAASQVPLQLWWSTRDELVIDGASTRAVCSARSED